MFKTDTPTIIEYKDIIVDFIRQYAMNSCHKKAVVGLSGGVDSALTYFLTCEALGEQNTIGIIMPYKTSNKSLTENAEKLIEMKGGIKKYYEISGPVDSFREIFGDVSDIRLGNIMARTRMITLYDTASRAEGLVIGTSNKTEILLGYFTVYGDGGCSMEPLGDLYKTEVWEMAGYVGIPDKIITEKPTADLWAGQTDEAELGILYRTADSILYLLVEKNFSRSEIIDEGYRKEDIDRVIDLMKKSRFKRHTPPVPGLRSQNSSKFL